MTPVEALQAWLALEHEAVWLYPVLGARQAGDRGAATASYAAHRRTRDALLVRLRDAGAEPVGARLSYGDLPSTRSAGRAAARDVEARTAAACAVLAGVTTGRTRAYAVAGLRRAALAGLAWGGEPEAFPGLDRPGPG